MKITNLALVGLVGTLLLLGCGDDGDSSDGASGGTGGGTAGTGGSGGSSNGGSAGDAGDAGQGSAGSGGTAGGGGTAGSAGAAGGAAAGLIFCPKGSLDNIALDLAFPDGIKIPLEAIVTPEGTVSAGSSVDVELSETSPIELTQTLKGSVRDGSFANWEVVSGGTGTIDLTIPVQDFEGEVFAIDGGTGTGTISVDAGATEVALEPQEMALKLDISTLAVGELDVMVGENGNCEFQDMRISVPVD